MLSVKFPNFAKTFKRRMVDFTGTIIVQIYSINLFQFLLRKFKTISNSIFALDLHTSVTRDLQKLLITSGFRVRRWSISGSSYLFHEPNLRISYINNHNWEKINQRQISKFQSKYRFLLENQDAFLVSHSLSFVQIYSKFKKPILAINSTRYESPYTFNFELFQNLNRTLIDLYDAKQIKIVSNNLADHDYLKFYTGIESTYIPSLCNYTEDMRGESGKWIVMARDSKFANRISSYGTNIVSQQVQYPGGFTYQEFASNMGVILFPYNISTMRLFELTTAGFPVRIPSDRLLIELSNQPGILSELSWVQVAQRECPEWLKETPADPNWDKFYSWWLRRADWCDSTLFPNVSRFDSLEELSVQPNLDFKELIAKRNSKILEKWERSLNEFTNL